MILGDPGFNIDEKAAFEKGDPNHCINILQQIVFSMPKTNRVIKVFFPKNHVSKSLINYS